jgi:c-di-GMP phosphodiesterase
MFNRHSIKFKLFIMVSAIILSFLLLFSLFWYMTTQKTSEQIGTLTQEIFKESSRKNAAYQMAQNEKHLESYFSLVADMVALDCYNLDYDAVQEKIGTFLEHVGVCSIEIVDALRKSDSASVIRNCDSKVVFETHIPVLYKNERVSTLKIGYSLEHINERIDFETQYLNTQAKALQESIESSFLHNFYVQKSIFILLSLMMLYFVWHQIGKSVVKPITLLLDQMQSLNYVDGVTSSRVKVFEETEIGQLSEYFHKHIAKLLWQLNVRANYDAITHLYSRQKLIDDLSTHVGYTLVILDLENFKEANNFYGLDTGDKILEHTAKALKFYFEPLGVKLYRINSDEFAILRTHEILLKSFLETLDLFSIEFPNEEFVFEENSLSFNIAMGMTDERESPIKSITAALIALRHAKNARETIVCFTQELPLIKEYEHNISVVKRIKRALKKNKVVPYFQPIFSYEYGTVVKYEALMRLEEKNEVIGPMEFLEIAKRAGLYHKLSEQMVMGILHLLKRDTQVHIALNLSIRDIVRTEFCAWIFAMLKNNDFAQRITFEITEQEGIENFDVLKDFITQAHAIGAKIAIDDFGSGYSNFEHLIHLHVDYLKIDGSLIKHIDTDVNAQIIVETIVRFAKAMGIQTVAEYVCSEAIFEYVRSIGVDFSQGYFIAPPNKVVGA